MPGTELKVFIWTVLSRSIQRTITHLLFLMTVHIIRPPYECLLETVFLFSQPKHDVGTHKNRLDELPGSFEHTNIGLN